MRVPALIGEEHDKTSGKLYKPTSKLLEKRIGAKDTPKLPKKEEEKPERPVGVAGRARFKPICLNLDIISKSNDLSTETCHKKY